MNERIQLIFPLLIPIGNDQKEYKGYIQFQNKQYPIEIKIKKSGFINDNSNLSEDDLELKTNDDFSNILSPFMKNIKSRINQCKDLNQFFFELKDILEKIPKQDIHSTSNNKYYTSISLLPIDTYVLILSEINEIGWDKVLKLNESLTEVKILLKDQKNREFIIDFKLDLQYPRQPPIVSSPILVLYSEVLLQNEQNKQQSNNNSNTGTLSSRLSKNQFNCSTITHSLEFIKELLKDFSLFFDVMDRIDKNSWVLEPEYPKSWVKSRRIVLEDQCSLCFDVNPMSPCTIPMNYRLLGPEKLVKEYKMKFNNQWNLWNDTSSNLIENFQTILSVRFPLKQFIQVDESAMTECGVCYANKDPINGITLPDVVCPNLKCKKQFHHSCIYEWFKSLPNCYQSFTSITGSCPYCTNNISVSLK